MNNDRDVFITGIGPVTALGIGADQLWPAMRDGRSQVSTRQLPFDLGRIAELPMAAIDGSRGIHGLEPHVKFLESQDAAGYRDLAYALLAVELALRDAKLEIDRDQYNVGVIQAFEAPGVEQTVARLFGMMSTPPPADAPPQVYEPLAPFFYAMQPFLYVHLMGKAFGFHGFSTSVHNACTSGAFAFEIAADRIRRGECDVMIVAGGEAFDTAVRLEWFRRLELYARDPIMRPFDAESSGFYVGEGGGAIVLESRAHAQARGAQPYATYLGGALAQQSWKQVIPDVRGGRLRDCMQEALRRTDITPREIDLIVPHGAATQLSDGYEAACIAEALHGVREHSVATAFKPYFGHLLAANVILETIAAMLALKHQSVPATLHTHPDRVKLPIPLATAPLQRPINTVMKLSTGFTGHDAALLFRREARP